MFKKYLIIGGFGVLATLFNCQRSVAPPSVEPLVVELIGPVSIFQERKCPPPQNGLLMYELIITNHSYPSISVFASSDSCHYYPEYISETLCGGFGFFGIIDNWTFQNIAILKGQKRTFYMNRIPNAEMDFIKLGLKYRVDSVFHKDEVIFKLRNNRILERVDTVVCE